MREIIFRGKRKNNGEWIYGYYYQKQNPFTKDGLPVSHLISDLPPFGAEIDPETVGQYTGLTDKNGNKIWEGDIVKAKIIEFSGEKYIGIWEVAYHTKYGYFYLKRPKNNLLFDGNWSYGVTKIEVIGNIHDNSEILKGGTEE